MGNGLSKKFFVRKASIDDAEDLLKIYHDAQQLLKNLTKTQWQNNYPNIETIKSDLECESLYVVFYDLHIVGCFTLIFGDDPNYFITFDGEFLNDEKYATIHRLAVKKEYYHKGIASFIIENCIGIVKRNKLNNIRADTHEKNIYMQKLLEKFNFQKVCFINVQNDCDPRRIAYHLVFDD